MVQPVKTILSLTTGNGNTEILLRNQGAFQRLVNNPATGSTQAQGPLIHKLLTPLGQRSHYVSTKVFALLNHKVYVEPCPRVRGINNTQKTRERKQQVPIFVRPLLLLVLYESVQDSRSPQKSHIWTRQHSRRARGDWATGWMI